MTKLSVVLIVKNEAQHIEDCLATVAWADEIVVLDAGSTDDTVARARRYTERVEISANWHGFGIQRQRAQSLASGDWVLMLDADERVSPGLAEEIRGVVQANERHTAYALPRLSWCFGRFIRHSGWYPDYVVRLYPRDKGHYNDNLVHEKVQLKAGMQVRRLRSDLLHFTYDSLHHYLTKSAQYAEAWADQRQQQGRQASLAQGIFHGVGCFMRMYVLRLGVLDGKQGLLLALLSAHSTFAKYADLWSRRQPNSP